MKKILLLFLFNIFVVLASFAQSSDFTGTYYNGVRTKQIDLSGPLYVKAKAGVRVESPKLVNATITYLGSIEPSYTYYEPSLGILEFAMPLSTVVVHVVCSDGTSYYLPFLIAADLKYLE